MWRRVSEPAPARTWHTSFAERLADQVDAVSWLPDKRLAPLVRELEGRVRVRTLASEEECIGYAAGTRAAGGMAAVLCQSSGIGNALNALASLAVPYGLGFPLVVSMRGTLGEGNPAQTLLGKRARPLLESLGVQVLSLADPASVVRVVDGAVALARGARDVVAILVEPELDLP